MQNLELYLEKKFFKRRLDYLNKKYKNKPILVYGCGSFFETIAKNYDLNTLNIVAISDKRFKKETTIELNSVQYRAIPADAIKNENSDYILVGTFDPNPVIRSLKRDYKVKNIEPFLPNNPKLSWIKILSRTQLMRITFVKNYINFKKRNLFYLIDGDGNKKLYPKINGLDVHFDGNGSKVVIYGSPMPRFLNFKIKCKSNTLVKINSSSYLIQNTTLNLDAKKSKILIDKNFSINGGVFLINYDAVNTKIVIGEDCMFGWDILLRTSDAHVIYDNNSKEIINHPGDIIIGNHVWIAAKSNILKNVILPNNTIVGTCSLVNKQFSEENTLVTGTPATVKKKFVNWSRANSANYIKPENLIGQDSGNF
ncbi:MAG: acyltransferase [Candidatus Gastranaerophilales bacterium]|nr:acyltransferase [Candidatus Gastranaerophilales bacterium]